MDGKGTFYFFHGRTPSPKAANTKERAQRGSSRRSPKLS